MERMKKILFLGGPVLDTLIIKHAKHLGYYTIITDSHKDWSRSPGKLVADEAWDISWSDIPALKAKIEEINGVDSVFTGFDEIRVSNMIKLADELGLNCYLTEDQLKITRDKELFKKTCRKYGIPVVPEYTEDEVSGNSDLLPVIIKPVDRAGSIGISVAHDMHDFKKGVNYAMELSLSKQIVIEKFFHADSKKFDVYYYVKDGEIYFIGSSDTVMCSPKIGYGILQKGWTYPSVKETVYLEKIDPLMRKMFSGIEMDNGHITMSAFVDDLDNFYFFEAGYRLSGELSFNYCKESLGFDYVKDMLRFSAGDENRIHITKRKANVNSVILNFFVTDGVISSIKGVDKIKEHPSVKSLIQYVKVGDKIHSASQILPKAVMVTLFDSDKNRLKEAVEYINANLDIIDDKGLSMIYERLSVNELKYYTDA